ncbi:MAG: aldehyde dehydrogenase EutE [Candidatus Schekmanbacteria bacterium]|nr:aldehyde dehydrogenase EutE [Candidatus Schekmanbacteria bacterium]
MSESIQPVRVDENQIKSIVERVVARLEQQSAPTKKVTPAVNLAPAPQVNPPVEKPSLGIGVFPNIESAVNAAETAFDQLDKLTLAQRCQFVDAMRKASVEQAPLLARMAYEETGLGRYEHKLKKILLAAEKTPGCEILEPTAYSGDHGLTLVERAPYGIIGAITPVTNPVATIICNAIGMIAGGNSVVFNPHPSARKTSIAAVQVLNEAVVRLGGPANLICTVAEPTIQSAQELMKHPKIRLMVVTGGPAVVKVAMQSGKKVIAAGPGNPPVVVDETADIPKAARDIVDGASFENNIVCALEKETIAVDSIADELKNEMKKAGAYEIKGWQIERLKKLIIREEHGPGREGVINKEWVGKDAQLILEKIGVEAKPDVRLILAEVDSDHVFFWTELLMPVMALVRVKNVEEAIKLAKEVEQGNGHTAVMHSRNIDNLSKMARTINTSIFVKNGPSYAGLGMTGEGFASFSIASPTGEGLTNARTFTRERRCVLVDSFRII